MISCWRAACFELPDPIAAHRAGFLQFAQLDTPISSMTALNWILFGLTCCAFGLVLLMALMEVAGREDRAARHHEKRMDPWSDVTITRFDAPVELRTGDVRKSHRGRPVQRRRGDLHSE